MQPQLISENLVVYARPRFKVDGSSEAGLSEDLISLDVRENEEGMARLEATFLNWGRASENREPDFVYLDAEVLDLGKEIEVHAGDEDNSAVIFNGVITALEGVYPELRPPEIVVRAEDRLQWQRMRQRTRFFEDRQDMQMAGDIAGDHGLGDDSQTEGPSHGEFWQVNQSDLGFLRERARAVDARLAVEDGSLVFRPRRENSDPPIQMTRANELLNFRICADLSHQRAEVHVHGYSIAEKTAIHEVAAGDALQSETNGAGVTGPDLLSDLQSDAVEHLHLEAPATAEEAGVLARSIMRRRGRRFVFGRGVTNGTPALRVGTRVELVDLGPRFSGIYHVAQVRHSFDQSEGLRTHFQVESVELGAAS